MIYLDNSATTRQYDEVTELMYRMAKENYGNPSSLHTLGFDAGNILFDARRNIEDLMHPGGEVIFTSGGTESDNMALVSTARKLRRRGNHILTTRIEHPAVLETCRRLADDGFEVEYLSVDSSGCIDPDAVSGSLREDTIIVSVMAVNNETGAIQPVIPAAKAVKEHNRNQGFRTVFHTDAVQAFGKLPLDSVDFDLVSVSGHKFHGPKGTGFLYMNKDLKLPAFITGGGQENGYRSSTENTAGIAGLGLAAAMSHKNLIVKMSRNTLHDYGMRCPGVLNLTFRGTRGEVLLHTLEQDRIYVSTGSACSSHKTGDSHVLQAMGLDHKAIEGAIRFSFSEFNTKEEMDIVIDRTKAAVTRFRKLGSFR